jgi:two-component system LytT family sensor kinase
MRAFPEYKTVLKKIFNHLLAWTAINLFMSMSIIDYPTSTFLKKFLSEWLWVIPNLPYAYLITYLLIPALLSKGRMVAFFTILALCQIVFLPINYLYAKVIIMPFQHGQAISFRDISLWTLFSPNGAILINITAAIFCSMNLLEHYFIENRKILKLEQEKISGELQQLRSQLNPQFLIYTLESLHKQLKGLSRLSAPLVLHLSNLLRYVLYESCFPLVCLENELDAAKAYLALEKIRCDQKLDCSVSISGSAAGKDIPPMVLLPFIEAVFKYVDPSREALYWVNLDIQVDGEAFKFKMISNCVPLEDVERLMHCEEIRSVRERLEISCNDGYSIKIIPSEDAIVIIFSIQLYRTINSFAYEAEMSVD